MKTEEVQELVVLTDEQIEFLPKEVKENVVFLTENMNNKDLMVLNPIVIELMAIKNDIANLVFKPIGEDGKWDKQNIQTFVDAKKRIRAFNGELGRSSKTLKEPYLAIQKGIVAIEKAIKSESDNAMAEAESIFKDYVDWEESEKKRKEDAKNRALLKKVEQAESIVKEAQDKQEITATYNKIKYDFIHKNLVENVTNAILDANQRKIESLRTDIESWTYENTVKELISNTDILSDELQSELHMLFSQSKTKAIRLLDDKIQELKTNSLQPAIVPVAPILSPVPPPPTHGLAAHIDLTDEEFVKYVSESVANLLNLTVLRIKANPKCASTIYDLRNRLSKF